MLTHLKKGKVSPWSLATSDKLSSKETNFGSEYQALPTGRKWSPIAISTQLASSGGSTGFSLAFSVAHRNVLQDGGCQWLRELYWSPDCKFNTPRILGLRVSLLLGNISPLFSLRLTHVQTLKAHGWKASRFSSLFENAIYLARHF